MLTEEYEMKIIRDVILNEMLNYSDNSDNLDLESIDYDKDKVDPIEKKLYNEKGQLTFDGTIIFNNDRWKKWNGKFKNYYENGNLKREGEYKEGKYNGKIKNYYENGNLKKEAYAKEGKYDGKIKEYYENGNLKKRG